MLPKYRCSACLNEFDEPIYKSLDELISIFYESEDAIDVRERCFVTNNKWKNKNNLSYIKYFFQRTMAITEDSEIIKKEGFLLYLYDVIKYLSFEDAITTCRKCAFNEDINNMELCPNCNEHYKGIKYPTCIECLPEDKRHEALEMMEFGKAWRAISI